MLNINNCRNIPVEDKCKEALKNAETILLVDWINADVPFALLGAGFKGISFAPGGYSIAKLEHQEATGKSELVFETIDTEQQQIDLVYVYRPLNEHATIIDEHILPHGANVLWLQPTLTSQHTAAMAAENGLIFVEGIDILSALRF